MANHGVRWGLYGALASILVTMILYFVDPKVMLGSGQWIGMIVMLVVMVKAGLDTRADQGGYMTWGEALKPTWLTYVVASLMGIIFFFVLVSFIDPGLLDIQREISIEAAEKMASMFGADEDAIDEIREQMSNDDNPFSIGKLAFGYAFGLIFPGFVMAAIISLFIRKKDPSLY